MTRDEHIELAALAGYAWEHRDEPDFRAHVARIVGWFDRRHVREYERRLRSRADVLQCLRETRP